MGKEFDEFSIAKRTLAKDIVGEIVLSNGPSGVIRKWRNIFKISQKALANELGITSSVVSDYESGRRKSPGIRVIKNYVNALLAIDISRGGVIIRSFAKNTEQESLSSAVIDIREFNSGVSMKRLCKLINAGLITKDADPNKEIFGYTIVDSLKAITEFSFNELIKLYGTTTQRVLIFTEVTTGKTPMVAIKLTNLHPALVVLHGLDVVDDVAKRIAEVEGIPLAVCRLGDVDDIIEKLKRID